MTVPSLSPFARSAAAALAIVVFSSCARDDAGLPIAAPGTTHAAEETQFAVVRAEPHFGETCERFARYLPTEHLTRALVDDVVSRRAWTNYLSSLDYEHVYFLQSDIDGFARRKELLDDALKSGELMFAYEVFEIFKQRVRDRVRYIDSQLERGFQLDKDESYKWQRKDGPWPGDAAERDEIWRKKIKNEYVRQLVGRELVAERAAERAGGEPEDGKKPEDAGEEAGEEAGEAPPPEEFIRKRYRQVVTVLNDSDADWVLQKYLTAFAHAYDPHSAYMSPSSVEDFNIEMRLSLVGIGALLRAEDGAARIVRVIPGGPAARDKRDKRLRPGDKIIAVGQDDEPAVDILHWPLQKVVKIIRGKKDTKVVLTVIPASDPTGAATKKVDLIRDEVKLEEQAAKSDVRQIKGNDGTTRKFGVIRLPAFYSNLRARHVGDPDFRSAAYDVAKSILKMEADGIHGLVLDLRNNGGGSLLEAVRVAGLFIADGPTVQVKEKHSSARILDDPDPAVRYEGPLLVLVNRLSASASEIVAGALQDYGRAVVVGDSKTHGKGSVQTIMKIGVDRKYGSIKITSAIYYRITGKSTQLDGVKPDIVVPSAWNYLKLGEDSLRNALRVGSVKPALYEGFADLSACLPVLLKQSEQRRAASEQFAAYAKLLKRVEAMNKAEELTLNAAERKRVALAEENLRKLQEKLSSDGGETDDKKTAQDVVLTESLAILSDFVIIKAKQPELVKRIGDGRSSRGKSIFRNWGRGLL
ncbi:carboxy terminal-processing peptidase [Verrucomicrobiota bacterium]